MQLIWNPNHKNLSAITHLFLVELMFALTILVPWTPESMSVDVRDAAYTIMAHVAHANGQPWGVLGLHTSGPWGFLNFPVYYEQTYPLVIAANVLIALAISTLLTWLAYMNLKTTALRVFFCLGMTWVLSFSNDTTWLFLIMSSQIFLPSFSQSKTWTIAPDWHALSFPFIICLLAAAFACSVKGTFLLFGIVLFLELVVLELMAHRLPSVALTYVFATMLIAASAGFMPSDWETHLHYIFESISGYSETFSMFGPLNQLVVFFGALISFLVIAAWLEVAQSSGLRGMVRWLGVAAFVWLNYKGAFIRQDVFHVIRGVASFSTFGIAFMMSAHPWGRSQYPQFVPKALVTTVITIACAYVAIQVGGLNAQPYMFYKRVSDAVEFVTHGTSKVSLRDREVRRKIADAVPLTLPDGATIGIFGTFQSPIVANGLTNTPLRVIAPYEVWTANTVNLQRRYLESPTAPDYLLYTSSPRSAEIAVTLARLYEPYSFSGSWPVLKRRAQPLRVTERQVFDGDVSVSNTIKVPLEWRQSLAIINVQYRKTFLNWLISILYQPPQAYLTMTNDIEAPAEVRLNQHLANKGIVLASRPGSWNSEGARLHGIQFDLLTKIKTDATQIDFSAIGPLGNNWSTYFGTTAHVQVRLVDFSPGP